jgi:hypothetical protein
MATTPLNRAGGAVPVTSQDSNTGAFEEVLAPFKERLFALDHSEVARKALEGINRFAEAVVIDPGDGIRWCFEGLALPQELIDSTAALDSYVKDQRSHQAIESLKASMGVFAAEFTAHIQERFKNYDELIALGHQLEAAGQREAAVRAFYAASLEALRGPDLEKLGLAANKVKELDPEMASLELQERTNLLSQTVIIRLSQDLRQTKQDLDVTTQELGITNQRVATLEADLAELRETARGLLEAKRAQELAKLRHIRDEYGFGPDNWLKYFGEVEAVPELPENIESILESPCPFWEGEKVKDTHVLVLIPTAVKGTALTLRSFAQWIGSPRNGGHQAGVVWPGGRKEKSCKVDQKVKNPYWVLMTKTIVPNSRKKPYTSQQLLLKQNHRTPTLLEASAVMALHLVKTGEALYNVPTGENILYTAVLEKHHGRHLSLGGFRPSSWFVALMNYNGIAGVWKF